MTDIAPKVSLAWPQYECVQSAHHEILPQLITLAGVLAAVPLDTDSAMELLPGWEQAEVSAGDCNCAPPSLSPWWQVALDAAETFPVVSELLATQWVFDNYGDQTTGVRSEDKN